MIPRAQRPSRSCYIVYGTAAGPEKYEVGARKSTIIVIISTREGWKKAIFQVFCTRPTHLPRLTPCRTNEFCNPFIRIGHEGFRSWEKSKYWELVGARHGKSWSIAKKHADCTHILPETILLYHKSIYCWKFSKSRFTQRCYLHLIDRLGILLETCNWFNFDSFLGKFCRKYCVSKLPAARRALFALCFNYSIYIFILSVEIWSMSWIHISYSNASVLCPTLIYIICFRFAH